MKYNQIPSGAKLQILQDLYEYNLEDDENELGISANTIVTWHGNGYATQNGKVWYVPNLYAEIDTTIQKYLSTNELTQMVYDEIIAANHVFTISGLADKMIRDAIKLIDDSNKLELLVRYKVLKY